MTDKFKTCALILLCFVCVYSNEPKRCRKRVIVTRYVYETYLRSYVSIDVRKCYHGLGTTCTYSKLATTVDGRMVSKRIVDTKPVCCDGYIETDKFGMPCEPVCIPLCKNGVCSRPGECTCLDGYVPDNSTKHACLPICVKDCGHGVCTGPDHCTCNFGYTYQNQTCVPICDESCLNGTCIAPGSCECWAGYRKSESNNCIPYCFRGCVHGRCVSPESCACDEGYQQEEMGKCTPICTPVCENGTCVEPNKCECFPGYKLSTNWTCDPYCSKLYDHAICIAPETYECAKGYRNESNKCIPYCTNTCGNGTCVAPNVCECFPGYKVNHQISIRSNHNTFKLGNESVCVPECKNCNGTCILPNTCACDPPYEAMKAIIDEKSCCHNCSNSSNHCEFTTCVLRRISFEIETSDKEHSVSPSDPYEVGDVIPFTETLPSIYTESTTQVNSESPKDNYEDTFTNGEPSTVWTFEDVSTNSEGETNFKRMKHDTEQTTSFYWIISLVLCTLVILLAIIMFINKKSISQYFKGGSYVVEENNPRDVCQDGELPEYQYSSMLKRSERESSTE